MEDTEYVVENAIVDLINEFIKNPLYFNNEKILHYKFHDFLCNKTQFNIRWEYPTKEFYVRKDGNLIVDRTSNYNGLYDIALIDELEESISFAFEFKLDVDNGEKKIDTDLFSKHTRNDYEKITNPKNQVMNGYMIYFIWSIIESRATKPLLERKIKHHNKNLDILWAYFEACKINGNLKMALVECNNIEGKKNSRIRTHPNGWINVELK